VRSPAVAWRLGVAALLILAVGGAAAFQIARRTPAAQEPLRTLDSIQLLAEAFDAAPGPKLLLLLSPTCETCLGVATAVQRALESNGDASVRVFVVWGRHLRWDRLGPTQLALGRLSDSRVTQYSDTANSAALSLCHSTPGLAAMCGQSPVLYGGVLYFEPGARWSDAPSWQAFDEVPPQLKEGKHTP
jgi:hypothetical protein